MIKKIIHTPLMFLAIVAFVAFLLSGCSARRYNIANDYLDSTNTVNIPKYPFEYKEKTIQPYEFVEVRFAGLNPVVSGTLNNYGGVSLETTIETSVATKGQQVDKEGFLNFPLIGKVQAAGLTKDELRVILVKKVEPLLQDPFVYVALPKRGISVFGEVGTATFVTTKERASILDVIAKLPAGTPFSDLSKVKIYRQLPDGQRIMGNMNLNDTTFFQSPFFYPEPDDIVYIPANKSKSISTLSLYLTISGFVISLLGFIISIR